MIRYTVILLRTATMPCNLSKLITSYGKQSITCELVYLDWTSVVAVGDSVHADTESLLLVPRPSGSQTVSSVLSATGSVYSL